MFVPPADQRIAIRNKRTNEVSHAIRGHVPDGWEPYGTTTGEFAKEAHNKMADRNKMPQRKRT